MTRYREGMGVEAVATTSYHIGGVRSNVGRHEGADWGPEYAKSSHSGMPRSWSRAARSPTPAYQGESVGVTPAVTASALRTTWPKVEVTRFQESGIATFDMASTADRPVADDTHLARGGLGDGD